MITLATIADRPDLIPLVARWGWEQWGKSAGETLAASEARAASSTARLGPEQCFIVLDDAAPAAMASLVSSDLDQRPDLTPWLAGVYVDPPYRGRGHARRVVRQVERAAADAGVATLWLYTSTAPDLYRRLGWIHAERLALKSGPSDLMRRDLGREVPTPAPADR